MGHTEMLFAVAGMKATEVDDLTKKLAGDWSSFSPAERVALAFTRKQAQDPASITEEDIQQLTNHWGTERAWQVIWWASRCHYMTKVADAFQFPLEKENPFLKMPGARPATPSARK